MIIQKKIVSILIAALCVCAFAGVLTTVILVIGIKDEKNVIKVNIGDSQSGIAEFDDIGIIPGESVEYTVYLSGLNDGTYSIDYKFCPQGKSRLGNYIDAYIFYEGKTVCESKLSDLFSGESQSFICNVENDAPVKLTVRYTMPEDVSNEAQGAESSFELVIGTVLE